MVPIKRFHAEITSLSNQLASGTLKRQLQRVYCKTALGVNPNAYLIQIGSGAFKNCYSLTDDYVIKFATEANETDRYEKGLLKYADKDDIKCFFLPTYFLYIGDLPNPIDRQGDRYEYIIIQPTAITDGAMYNHHDLDDVVYSIDSQKDKINVSSMGIQSREWLNDALAYYGPAMMDRFNAFCARTSICDLSCNNIGYYHHPNGLHIPVIFDWICSI